MKGVKKAGWLPFLFLHLSPLAQEEVIRGKVLQATPQMLSLQVEGKQVKVEMAPDCSFFVYGRRMLEMVIPVGAEALVVARKSPEGLLMATSVCDMATAERSEAELEEGTLATLVSLDPEERSLTLRVKYGWTFSGNLDRKASLLKGGKPCSLADFKPGERVGVSARKRRERWVVEALADPVTHYLLFVRGGRAGTVKEVDVSGRLVNLDVEGRAYKIRLTPRTWLVVGGKMVDIKELKPGMEVLISRPTTRGGISFVRAMVEGASLFLLPPEVLLLLEEEPEVKGGRPVVGKLARIKGEEAVVEDILRGEVTFRLTEKTRFYKGGKEVKVEGFKEGEEVVAVPSAVREGIVYCGFICDLGLYEAVRERLEAVEVD